VSSIAELLREIEKRELILPEFQRRFVWSRAKVKAYIESIYRKYPTVHFLIWKTYSPPKRRGDGPESDAKYHRLILYWVVPNMIAEGGSLFSCQKQLTLCMDILTILSAFFQSRDSP